jgi:aryl-alcohol dehydrogenase-like predicted oxidoreductase
VQYRTLGKSGITVSEIGFGAWGIGGRTVNQTSYGDTDDRVSVAALERAADRGITLFDTSVAYGDGHSEELIGRTFASLRRRVVIATKAGYESWERAPDFSPAAIIGMAERSLARLRTDYLDVLQLHNATLDVLLSDDLQEALSRLRRDGKIRAWGASMKTPAEATEALRHIDIPVVQANFNMMDVRAATSGLFEAIGHRQAGFIARTPLCFGFLSGRIDRGTVFPPGDHRAAWSSAQRASWIDGAQEVLGAVPAVPVSSAVQAALRFCLAFAEVSSVIPGILTPQEADENAAASALGALPRAAVDAVLEINRRRKFFLAPAPAA